MKRYSVRSARSSDLDKVFDLIEKQHSLDYGEAMMSLADLKTIWQSLDLENNTCMAFAEGELAGYAELLDGDSPFIYLAERNNVDLSFQLLTILEEKAMLRKVKNLTTRISEKNRTLLQLFASNGYTSNLSFQIMELVMDSSPESAEWPEGIVVRTFIPGVDDERTYQADEEASQDKGYHALLDFEGWAKRMGLNTERFDPSLWFLAFDRSEIAGVALNMLDRASNTGWVDHLGVRRKWRNNGIGRALLQHTFGQFYQRGVRKIKLSVDSKSLTHAPKLYQSVGLETVQQYHIYKKELGPRA
jgi:GNAT superfamily N-acetyltransferase